MTILEPVEQSAAADVPDPVVFIVDDDPIVNDSLRFLVESVGLQAECFGNVGSFLDAFEPNAPGCVILDLHLPDGTGIDALRRLRDKSPSIPVMMVTAEPRVPKVVTAMRLGAIDFLEKPLDHLALLDKVKQAVERDVADWPRKAEVHDIRRRLETLTKKEREVLELVVEGLISRAIGDRLVIKEKTVEAHRASIARKMGSVNVSQLVNMVMRARQPENPFVSSDEPTDS